MRERAVLQLPVREANRLEQRPAQTLHDGAFHLVAQAVRIDDRAAFEGRGDAHQRRAGPTATLRAGRDVAALLPSGRDPDAVPAAGLGQPNRSAAVFSTARKRASRVFCSRNSSGSSFSAAAISSM